MCSKGKDEDHTHIGGNVIPSQYFVFGTMIYKGKGYIEHINLVILKQLDGNGKTKPMGNWLEPGRLKETPVYDSTLSLGIVGYHNGR